MIIEKSEGFYTGQINDKGDAHGYGVFKDGDVDLLEIYRGYFKNNTRSGYMHFAQIELDI